MWHLFVAENSLFMPSQFVLDVDIFYFEHFNCYLEYHLQSHKIVIVIQDSTTKSHAWFWPSSWLLIGWKFYHVPRTKADDYLYRTSYISVDFCSFGNKTANLPRSQQITQKSAGHKRPFRLNVLFMFFQIPQIPVHRPASGDMPYTLQPTTPTPWHTWSVPNWPQFQPQYLPAGWWLPGPDGRYTPLQNVAGNKPILQAEVRLFSTEI
jgi:hypothetical protein